MKRLITVALVVAVLGGFGALLYAKLFPSDEALIGRLLKEVAATASVDPDEKPMTRLGKAARLASQFADTVVIRVDVSGLQERTIQGRDELIQLIAGARANMGETKLEFLDVNISVTDDHAQVHATAFARISGQGEPTVQEIRMGLVRPDGKWRIERVETVRTLK